MLVGRENELEKIDECIRKRRSLILTGRRGAGKTALLKEVEKKYKACYIEYPFVKQILESLAVYFNLDFERSTRYMTVTELLDAVRPLIRKRKAIILIDEFDSISKHAGKLLEKLEDEGALIIGAGEQKKGWLFRFREELKLEGLNRKDSKFLAELWLKEKADDLVLDLIATKSMGYPGKIKEICRDYLIAYKNLDVSPLDRESIFEFFSEIRPVIPERINLLPIWALFVIGFGFLIVKYYFYSWGNFQEGYMVAVFGYMSLIIYRMINARKYEKN